MRIKPQTYALTAVTYQRQRLFQKTVTAELFITTLAFKIGMRFDPGITGLRFLLLR